MQVDLAFIILLYSKFKQFNSLLHLNHHNKIIVKIYFSFTHSFNFNREVVVKLLSEVKPRVYFGHHTPQKI